MKRFLSLVAAIVLPFAARSATVPLQNPVITGTLALNQSATTGFIPWANVATGGVLTGISTIQAATSAGITLTGGPFIVNQNVSPPLGEQGAGGQTLLEIVGTDSTQGRLWIDSFGAGYTGNIDFRHAAGSNASPIALTSGEGMGGPGWFGYNGSAYTTGAHASISVVAGENWTPTANGTYMSFFTTPNTTATQVEAVRIFGSGGVAIGSPSTTTDPGLGGLHMTGALLINNTGSALAAPPSGTLVQIGSTAGTPARVLLDGYATNDAFDFRRADGTAASPTAIQSGENIGVVVWRGYGATGYSSGSRATIIGQASQNWTDSAQGTLLQFETTPNNSTTEGVVFTLNQDGSAVFAGAVSGITTLGMSGALTATGNIQSNSGNLITTSGNLSIAGTSLLTGVVTHSAQPVFSATASPTSSGTGTTGQFTWDGSYIYICTATNTWRRVATTGSY